MRSRTTWAKAASVRSRLGVVPRHHQQRTGDVGPRRPGGQAARARPWRPGVASCASSRSSSAVRSWSAAGELAQGELGRRRAGWSAAPAGTAAAAWTRRASGSRRSCWRSGSGAVHQQAVELVGGLARAPCTAERRVTRSARMHLHRSRRRPWARSRPRRPARPARPPRRRPGRICRGRGGLGRLGALDLHDLVALLRSQRLSPAAKLPVPSIPKRSTGPQPGRPSASSCAVAAGGGRAPRWSPAAGRPGPGPRRRGRPCGCRPRR